MKYRSLCKEHYPMWDYNGVPWFLRERADMFNKIAYLSGVRLDMDFKLSKSFLENQSEKMVEMEELKHLTDEQL